VASAVRGRVLRRCLLALRRRALAGRLRRERRAWRGLLRQLEQRAASLAQALEAVVAQQQQGDPTSGGKGGKGGKLLHLHGEAAELIEQASVAASGLHAPLLTYSTACGRSCARSMVGSSSAPELHARGVHAGSPLPPLVAPRAAAAAAACGRSEGASDAAEWQIDAAAVAQFKLMFEQACAAVGPGTDRLDKSQAGALLSISGLPTEVLLAIWSLADADGDDRLDLRE
jgi:hypothetical protein